MMCCFYVLSGQGACTRYFFCFKREKKEEKGTPGQQKEDAEEGETSQVKEEGGNYVSNGTMYLSIRTLSKQNAFL